MTTATGKVFVITGPSGVGKGTLCKQILALVPELTPSISATSRSKRPDEREGVEYYFLERHQFEQMASQEEFLEWAEYNGNYYGTPKFHIEKNLASGRSVLLEIDTQGALMVEKLYPDAVLIFIQPPSMEELEARLRGRGTNTDDDILGRLAIAHRELALKNEFDYIVTNNNLETCLAELQSIFRQSMTNLQADSR
jgi:guanylate kinase